MSLKTAVSAFLVLLVVFSLASVSYAMSIDKHLITGSDPNGYSGCATPPAKTSFSPTDSRVYSWVLVSGAFLFDSVTWKWYAPDNSVYATYPYTLGVIGSACTWGYIDISGQAAASKTGTWKVEIYNGSTLAATDTFTLGKPLCTYTYSAWGACQSNGTQERTIVSSSPSGCTDWLPPLTQICTYVPPALAAPQNFRFTLYGDMLTIQWDAVAGATGYKVGLGAQSGTYLGPYDLGNIIKAGPLNIATAPAGTYYFAVKAYNGDRESAYSNEIVVKYTPSVLLAPQHLGYSLIGNMLTIQWDAVDGATNYKAGLGLQSKDYSGPYDVGKITKLGPLDVSEFPAATFFMAVKSSNANKESRYSNEIAMTFASPKYKFSDDQKGLIAAYGIPEYFNVAFNAAPQRREEGWIYTKYKKIYIFWDGLLVHAEDLPAVPAAVTNPSYIDPSLLRKDTRLADLVQIFGSNYTLVAPGNLSTMIGSSDLKTYNFIDKGLFASFSGGNLVAAMSGDLPGRTAKLEAKRSSATGQQQKTLPELLLLPGSDNLVDAAAALLATSLLVAKYGGYDLATNDPETWNEIKEKCAKGLQDAECKEAMLKAVMTAKTTFVGSAIFWNYLDISATIKPDLQACQIGVSPTTLPAAAPGSITVTILGSTPKTLLAIETSYGASRAGVTDAAGKGSWTLDVPAKPGGTIHTLTVTCGPGVQTFSVEVVAPPCTVPYPCNAWTKCLPEGNQTCTDILKTPAGCTGTPPNPYTQSCTYVPPPACVFQYTDCIEPCQPNGTCQRDIASYGPEGCVGIPQKTGSCTYTPPACTYTYSAWGSCQPSNTQTRTVTSAEPPGCTGNSLLTQTCTYCPSDHPTQCSDNKCYLPGSTCCAGGGAAPAGYTCCGSGGNSCPNSQVCVSKGCCPAATPFLCANGVQCCATP